MKLADQTFFVYRKTVYIPITEKGYILPGGYATLDDVLVHKVAERMFKLTKGQRYYIPNLPSDNITVTTPSGRTEYTTKRELGDYCKKIGIETSKANKVLIGEYSQHRGYVFSYVKSNEG